MRSKYASSLPAYRFEQVSVTVGDEWDGLNYKSVTVGDVCKYDGSWYTVISVTRREIDPGNWDSRSAFIKTFVTLQSRKMLNGKVKHLSWEGY